MISIFSNVITADNINQAVDAIKQGRLVAFGTETVYGLGGNAYDDHAVARIFSAKGRPSFNPLISHVPDVKAAFTYGTASPLAEKLASLFWPGPMTLIMTKPEDSPISDLATAGLDSIAIRVPAIEPARRFLEACGTPIVAPSANRSGRISPTTAAHVLEELGSSEDLAAIIDVGPAQEGLESTVIDAQGQHPVILRPGSITAEQLTSNDLTPQLGHQKGVISPGQMKSHYAPEKPVHVNIASPSDDDIHISFGTDTAETNLFNLSPSADLVEAAANLYHALRMADKAKGCRITIAPIPHHGLGHAINDRLTRAASTR